MDVKTAGSSGIGVMDTPKPFDKRDTDPTFTDQPPAAEPISSCSRPSTSSDAPDALEATFQTPALPHRAINSLKRKSSAMTPDDQSPFHVSTPETMDLWKLWTSQFGQTPALPHRAINSLKRKSSAMTPDDQSPFHMSTPETMDLWKLWTSQFGQAIAIPSAESKKRWKRFIDDSPSKPKSPSASPKTARRQSTCVPVSAPEGLQRTRSHDQLGLTEENDELKAQFEKVRASVRAEYDDLLAKMKAHMKSTCYRALDAKDEKHENELKDLKDVVKAQQAHIIHLNTNLWDTSNKLLIERNENKALKTTVIKLKRMLSLNQCVPVSAPEGLQRTRSHDQLGLQHQNALQTVEEEVATVSRQQSTQGKVFPSEDEAEDMFNNDCLANLKAGRCQVSADPERMSTLMYRISLPPHLKSSCPVETRFLPIDTLLQKDDIKGRVLGDDAKLGPLPVKQRKYQTQGRVLGDDAKLGPLPVKRRKYQTQGRVLGDDAKLGPLPVKRRKYQTQGRVLGDDAKLGPLPVKRRKYQTQNMELKNVSTPRSALREVNDENRKPGTPSRLSSNTFAAQPPRNETDFRPLSLSARMSQGSTLFCFGALQEDNIKNMELKNVSTPRSALREVNDENRKPGTPSRLSSNTFAAQPPRNENL